jgi:hypothetical protein
MRWKLVLFGIALVVAAVVLWLLWRSDRVSEQTYQQIRLGMSLDEVEHMLGGPGRVYSDFADEFIERAKTGKPLHISAGTFVSEGDMGVLDGIVLPQSNLEEAAVRVSIA